MDETTRQANYCGACMVYIGPTGKRVDYEDPDLILWIECERCIMGRLEREAQEGEARALEDERARPRVCQLDGCDETFVPRPPWTQRFCRDEHRWLAARARRRLLAEAG